ncbi:hypothetical protein NQZ68_008268 [Dissostichus eleginoides]|nr:hypothetical protein NQZ68_008268 [Dissostichus eleginoides]
MLCPPGCGVSLMEGWQQLMALTTNVTPTTKNTNCTGTAGRDPEATEKVSGKERVGNRVQDKSLEWEQHNITPMQGAAQTLINDKEHTRISMFSLHASNVVSPASPGIPRPPHATNCPQSLLKCPYRTTVERNSRLTMILSAHR